MTREVLCWDDVEEAARLLAGNHRQFECFAWHDRPEDADDWAIIYVRSRDSRLLEESNAEAIRAELEEFLDGEDIVLERHNHWAVGWVEGYAVRVYARPRPGDNPEHFSRDHQCLDCKHSWTAQVVMAEATTNLSGEKTQWCPQCGGKNQSASEPYRIAEAFKKVCWLNDRLSDYPVLDEEDYSEREYEATLANIAEVGRRWVRDDAPEDWDRQCFSWFWDNDQGAVESSDDQGGYPSDEEMAACLCALGFVDWWEYDPALLEDHDVITTQGKLVHETESEEFYFFRRGIYMVKYVDDTPTEIHHCD